MTLVSIDWIIIIAYLLISLGVGLYYREKAGKSLGDFFLGGRNLPWHVAGISMVATTFAADTPLAVNELVYKNGIAGNWIWWCFLFGGMLTTFFFARLWRRAEVLTEVELIELRYGGKPAAFLRGFKAAYLGLFMNVLIVAWVNLAMVTIFEVFFGLSRENAMLYTGGAMFITAIYSSISGLIGVAITDMIQFLIAMAGCIILAILVLHSDKIGGIEGLKSKLAVSHPESLNFLPKLNGVGGAVGTYALSIGAFLAFVGVQWWASWYPGGEPGGGGYVAQRMMSAKNEKHSIFATLFFNIAHYCLRPWPWILVGLCALVLYPNLHEDQYRLGYVMAMREYLPSGLKGLMLVAFLAAYMSTISTQLNWGASYLVNDLYKRFIRREETFPSEEQAQKHYVMMSRVGTMLTMVISLGVTPMINSISGVWGFIMECGAGLGLVLILRWYWWRINAWSEISATIIPFVVFGGIKLTEHLQISAWHDKLGYAAGQEMSKAQFDQFYAAHPCLTFPGSFFLTVGITTVGWIMVTYLTRPEMPGVLRRFYERVRPGGAWKPVQRELGLTATPSRTFGLVMCWLSAVLMTYSILFLSGKIIFHEWREAGWCAAVAVVSFAVLRYFVGRTRIFED